MHQALPLSIFIVTFITSHSLITCTDIDYGAVHQHCIIIAIASNYTCQTWFNHRVLVYVTLVNILMKMELKFLQDRSTYYAELSQ